MTLCGKHKRLVGRVVRVIAKPHALCFAVCFERLPSVKLTSSCAIITAQKLKLLLLS
ncbi:MAG: hypothetical protein AAI946_00685 [Candidatus Hodgkinia cicadicola]